MIHAVVRVQSLYRIGMLEQIDRIIPIDIYKNGVVTSGSYTELAKDFLQQILLIGDRLHTHLNVTMPINNWW